MSDEHDHIDEEYEEQFDHEDEGEGEEGGVGVAEMNFVDNVLKFTGGVAPKDGIPVQEEVPMAQTVVRSYKVVPYALGDGKVTKVPILATKRLYPKYGSWTAYVLTPTGEVKKIRVPAAVYDTAPEVKFTLQVIA